MGVLDFNSSTFDRRKSSRAALRNVVTGVHRSRLAAVDEISCPFPIDEPRAVGYTNRFHWILPISGSFQLEVGSRSYFAGPNHVVAMAPGCEYRIAHPVEGDRSFVLFPRAAMAELVKCSGRIDDDVDVRTAPARLSMAASLLISEARNGADPLTLDELTVEWCSALVGSLGVDGPSATPGRGATLSAAKEYLHAHWRDPVSLSDVAAAVGVTPVYLTQLFKRSAGMALHQYLLALRLNHALAELPDAQDLTALALDLGFSSHSHFTSLFRIRFGVTPSLFRARSAQDLVKGPSIPSHLTERPLCAARGGSAIVDHS